MKHKLTKKKKKETGLKEPNMVSLRPVVHRPRFGTSSSKDYTKMRWEVLKGSRLLLSTLYIEIYAYFKKYLVMIKQTEVTPPLEPAK